MIWNSSKGEKGLREMLKKLNRRTIIKTNEKVKKKLDRIKERAQEIKNQSKHSGEDNA